VEVEERERYIDSGCEVDALERASLKIGMASMLSRSGDGLGGGQSCPDKDRCTNYSCTGGFLRVFREWISGFHDRLRTRPSETSVDNHFTRQYNPEDSSEHHTRRRENLKSHLTMLIQN
jgi:hypothetical protein